MLDRRDRRAAIAGRERQCAQSRVRPCAQRKPVGDRFTSGKRRVGPGGVELAKDGRPLISHRCHAGCYQLDLRHRDGGIERQRQCTRRANISVGVRYPAQLLRNLCEKQLVKQRGVLKAALPMLAQRILAAPVG